MSLRKSNSKVNERTIVLKIGTSSIIARDKSCSENSEGTDTRLNIKQMATVVEVVQQLTRLGHKVIIVNSGAVGAGCHLLKYKERPTELSQCQALAACGQIHLMGKYESMFNALNLKCAQVLVTYETFRSKQQNQNASNTFQALLQMGVTPIVNENDTIATKEIKTDNDSMAAMVSNLVGADYLFLLTDVHGLYTENPHLNPDATLIRQVKNLDELKERVSVNSHGTWGTGGMRTKLEAAELATSMGIETIIMKAENVASVIGYIDSTVERFLGTTFEKQKCTVPKQRRWIRCLQPGGKIVLDKEGVHDLHMKENLGEKGIVSCLGNFTPHEAVSIVDETGKELARGLSNLSAEEIRQISESNEDVSQQLGCSVIDRHNLLQYSSQRCTVSV